MHPILYFDITRAIINIIYSRRSRCHFAILNSQSVPPTHWLWTLRLVSNLSLTYFCVGSETKPRHGLPSVALSTCPSIYTNINISNGQTLIDRIHQKVRCHSAMHHNVTAANMKKRTDKSFDILLQILCGISNSIYSSNMVLCIRWNAHTRARIYNISSYPQWGAMIRGGIKRKRQQKKNEVKRNGIKTYFCMKWKSSNRPTESDVSTDFIYSHHNSHLHMADAMCDVVGR